MKISKINIFFLLLLILSAFFFSLSYNIETRVLAEATIQSGQIDYPKEFNLYHIISLNSWSVPIQTISFLIKNNFSPLFISKIILFISTFMFLGGIYLITKFFTSSNLMAFLVAFLVILLKKSFGHLDYPTLIFSEHTNGLLAQAMFTLILGFLINNNFKAGLFFSVLLIPVHLTVGLWLNFIIILTLVMKFKTYKKMLLNKKNLIFLSVALTISLISFLYSYSQKMPFNLSLDVQAYKTYIEVWDAHRTAYGLYSDSIHYGYILKTLILVMLIFTLLRLKLEKNNNYFGITVLLVNCLLSSLLYICYKYFYFLFPDIVARTIPTRFFVLHSVIGWPVIFSIIYLLIKFLISKFDLNFKYIYNFFILILILNLTQHYSAFTERYKGIKNNLSIINNQNENEKFWNDIKNVSLNGYVLGSSGFDTCVKTIALAKKPLFFCPESID